jgi:hypothetical protein
MTRSGGGDAGEWMQNFLPATGKKKINQLNPFVTAQKKGPVQPF